MLTLLRELFEEDTPRAERFRTGLLLFDFVTLAFIIATSFIDRGPLLETIDVVLGLVIATEVAARVAASPRRGREVLRLSTLADLVAAASLLAPVTGEAAAFMRALRTLRLLRTAADMGHLAGLRGRNEEALVAGANLLVFIFLMTGVVYETQHRSNPDIGNYADALYFTVTALTTTGFGDITLPGTGGRLISIAIMIFGVTLFLRLAQVMFRPYKVSFACPTCRLLRHDPDAVHCKACGTVLAIPDEGT